MTLPAHVQVWPGHGSGSACGKALGAVPSTTVGYERLFAWWSPFLSEGDLEGFSQELLSGQPDVPSYFSRMKRQNRDGPAPVPTHALPELEPAALGGKLLIDTRPREAYHHGSLPNALSLSAGKNFETWAGWLIDPESRAPVWCCWLETGPRRKGCANGSGGSVSTTLPVMSRAWERCLYRRTHLLSPREFDALDDKFVLDVRTKAEYEEGHIPGATLIHAGRLPGQLAELPRDVPIVVHCQSGMRSVGAASLLRAHGFKNVLELAGGYPNWLRSQTVETG